MPNSVPECPPDPHAAIAAAEAQALAAHESGACHLSEFSCSHCEAAK